MKINIILLSVFFTFFTHNTIAIETSLRGFGSIIGTSLLSDEGYWVKHPSGAGLYDDDVGFDLTEETLIGLQGSFNFDDKLSVTAQVISRGQDDWEPNIEQFYVSYDLTSALNFKVGKIKNPVYLFSDSMDIHYSFGWVRTPGAAYSLSANFIEGLSAMYQTSFGDISNNTLIFYGRSHKKNDPFLTELFGNRGLVDIGLTTAFTTGEVKDESKDFFDPERWYTISDVETDIQDSYGISSEFYWEDLTLHLAFMEAGGEVDTLTYETGTKSIQKQTSRDFYDAAINYDDGNWVAIVEWNRYVDVYSSWYATIGMNFGDWRVLLTQGSFNGEVTPPGGGTAFPKQEISDTTTLSLRYDYTSGIAFKAELNYFTNEGSLVVKDRDGDGEIESTVLSFAVDFVF
ncbi:hypothetical protein HQQ94_02580 [Shewanella sp. VB17]|uniref:hypothetical protein n=1 Tax=Shewanella sp. VB17 TaxID=2739432 RepID=UPI0015641F68|nr:hypothetical protein [Shewanella sp. VB17]NRD72140.1 hypothetical protein [Shewanella sp. VB17]